MGKGAERPRLGRPGGRALRPCISTKKILHSYISVIVAVLLLSRFCHCRGFVPVAVLLCRGFVPVAVLFVAVLSPLLLEYVGL